jgi:hypothetical protein
LGDIPHLVVGLEAKKQNHSIAIALILITNQVASFEIPFEQLQALMLLFEELSNKAAWNLSVGEGRGPLNIVTDPLTYSTQIH